MIDQETIVIEVEADVDQRFLQEIGSGALHWVDPEKRDDVELTISPAEEGYGFGLTTLLTVVVSIGIGASSDLAADAVRAAVKGVIRRARRGQDQSDGSPMGLSGLIGRARGDNEPEHNA
jgi:hypothetical protein